MKRVIDESPDKGTTDTLGYFGIVLENETDNTGEVFLFDENRNKYNLDRVCLLSRDYSGAAGEVNIPKMYKILSNGKIIEQGAKVLISFPNGRYNPVVIGCINPLGFQNKATSELQINLNRLNSEVKIKNTPEFQYRSSISESGEVSESINNGSITKSATGKKATIHFKAEKNMVLEGEKINDVLGEIVSVGGNYKRPTDDEDNNKNKAESVYLYSKEVIIGHANGRGKKIKVDEDGIIDEPILQPLVMGVTMEALTDLLVTILSEAKYTGSGVITMMPTSVLELKKRIRERLYLIKSKVGFILYDPEQVKGKDPE